MNKYVCIRKCFWNDTLYDEGVTYQFPEDVTPPDYFQLISEIGEDVKTDEDEHSIESLQKELDELGKPYDRRWGKARLLGALHEARLEKNK